MLIYSSFTSFNKRKPLFKKSFYAHRSNPTFEMDYMPENLCKNKVPLNNILHLPTYLLQIIKDIQVKDVVKNEEIFKLYDNPEYIMLFYLCSDIFIKQNNNKTSCGCFSSFIYNNIKYHYNLRCVKKNRLKFNIVIPTHTTNCTINTLYKIGKKIQVYVGF